MGTFIGVEAVDRIRFFTCPAHGSSILTVDGQNVKTPRGRLRQLLVLGHRLRPASVAKRTGVLVPVPPGARILRADYPQFFWHLERQILGPGKPPPRDMVPAEGEYDARLVGLAEAEEHWGVRLEHPLAAAFSGEPAFLELRASLSSPISSGNGRTWEPKPIFILADLLERNAEGIAGAASVAGNPLFIPLSVAVAVQDAERETSADADDRWLEIRRRTSRRAPQIGYAHRLYLANCRRIVKREDLRADGWQLKASAVAPSEFYGSVDSGLLPEEVCIGPVSSLLRLRPSVPSNCDLYL
jgi:hypothetical protein